MKFCQISFLFGSLSLCQICNLVLLLLQRALEKAEIFNDRSKDATFHLSLTISGHAQRVTLYSLQNTFLIIWNCD